MNLLLQIPLEYRLVALFFLGTLAGSLVNWGGYALAWRPRAISPWSRAHRNAGHPRFRDFLPVVGWLGRRGESEIHGERFWLRPLIVELGLGIVFAWLYWLEIGWWGTAADRTGILPLNRGIAPQDFHPAADTLLALHAQYCAHVVLICLMAVASLTDIDEKTIPDTITIPGTLLWLVTAIAFPWSRLPADVLIAQPPQFDVLNLASPLSWPSSLEGFPARGSLVLALGCYAAWCFALLRRTWRTRRGWKWAIAIFVARVVRDPFTKVVLALGVGGTGIICLAWYRGGPPWESLLSALVGMAAGGGMIWAVRIIGRVTLRKEAMGFGDVTLMAMIGAYVGWQPSLVIFFLAPFAALLIGGMQWLLHKENEIFYGPYLCMATLVVLVRWPAVWHRLEPVFAMGWLVPATVVACLILMAAILVGIRSVTSR